MGENREEQVGKVWESGVFSGHVTNEMLIKHSSGVKQTAGHTSLEFGENVLVH